MRTSNRFLSDSSSDMTKRYEAWACASSSMSETTKTENGKRTGLKVGSVARHADVEGFSHSMVSASSSSRSRPMAHFENRNVPLPGRPSSERCFPSISPQAHEITCHGSA